MTCIKETSLIEWKSNYGWTDGQTWKKLMVATYIITGIRLAAILVIMSVSTFKTAVILYILYILKCPTFWTSIDKQK